MHKKGSGWILVGLFLIAAAICLTCANLWTEYLADKKTNQTLEELLLKIPEDHSNQNEEIEYPDYVLNPNMDMPVETVNGYEYIGVLTIPQLNLELPILSEWSSAHLKISPSRYEGSAYLDNLIICAHNYRNHFGRLKNLSIHDEIMFTDIDGHTFHYQIVEFESLQPKAVEEMESGEWDLTLFTCNLGGSVRFTVRCERID